MTVGELIVDFDLHSYNPGVGEDRLVTGGHIGDLLSHVMANCQLGDVWITILTNLNTIAVASLVDAACIILPQGIIPEAQVLKKASDEGIPILGSPLSAFTLCGKLASRLEA
ncbi:serine kinase [Armatimonadetes bacterium]|nr:serine kinase [bacterium]